MSPRHARTKLDPSLGGPVENGRLDELERYEILDTPPEAAFDDIVALAAQLCDTPVALVSLVDAHRQWFKSRLGWDVPEVPREHAFCHHAIEGDGLIEVPDAESDERFRDNPLVTGDPDIRFYAGAPLVMPSGHALGTLCVIDRKPRRLRDDQREALERLARRVVAELDLRLANRSLARQAEALARAEELSVLANLTRDWESWIDADGVLVWVNPAVERMTGYSVDECLAMADYPDALVEPADLPVVQDALQRGHAGEAGDDMRFRIRRSDGELRWMSMAWNPVTSDDGQRLGVRTSVRDVTEQRAVEESLRERESILSAVAFAAERLLPALDWEKEIGAILERLGEATGASRTYLFASHQGDGGERLVSLRHEWAAAGIPPAMQSAAWQSVPVESGFRRWSELLRDGRPVYGTLDELPENERPLLEAQGVASVAVLPVLVQGGLWGFVGFAQIEKARIWSPAELDALNAAARTIAGAIERERVDRQIRHTEQILRLFFENAPVSLAMLDNDLRHMALSRRWMDDLGVDESVLGLGHYDVFPNLPEQWKEAHSRALAGEVVRNDGSRFVRPDGSITWTRWEVRPWRHPDGEIGGIIIVAEDITQHYEAVAARRRQEEFGAALLDNIDAGVVACDADGTLVLFNRTAREWHGVDPRSIPPNEWSEHYDLFGPDGKTPLETKDIPLVRAFNEETVRDVRMSIVAAGQELRHVLASGSAFFDDDGRKAGAVVIMRDITARLEAEATAREAHAALDASDDGAFIFEPDTLRFTYVNQGAVHQVGYSSDELLAMTPVDLKPDYDEATFRSFLEPLMEGERPAHRFSTRHQRKDGDTIPVEITLQYVVPPEGHPRFIALVRDISERLAREQVERRTQRLESLGTLAGGIAHDLNNALAPMMISLELLRLDYPDEPETIDTLSASGRRAADMVRQLLTFAKGAEGRRTPVAPEALVDEMRRLMKGSFPKNVAVEVRCEPDLPQVVGDATQLHQVLLNLCVNARDAMPGGGSLTLEASRVQVDDTFASSVVGAVPGDHVLLRVRDTGTGIPPEVLDQVFDPFFTTKGDLGTGLGLSTTLGIVRGHDGFVDVYSRPGQGSVFSVYLPVGDTAAAVKEVVTEEVVAFRGNGEKVLFVDDEKVLREAATAVLGRLGFEPITAEDGATGMLMVADHRDDLALILTDLHMPHLDGAGFVRALRRILPDVPVVVASGLLDEGVKETLRSLGVDTFLDKPFTEGELVVALKAALSRE